MLQSPSISFRTVLLAILSLLISACFVAYIIWQSRLLLTGPVITLTEPIPATSASRTIEILGTARNIVRINLNGRPIVTTQAGDFKERVILENGYTVVTLEAADRYDRTTTLSAPIVYQPITE